MGLARIRAKRRTTGHGSGKDSESHVGVSAVRRVVSGRPDPGRTEPLRGVTMLETMLDLDFKGGRDYLHGTDIFNQTLSWLTQSLPDAPIENIDFSFHHLAR